ncbi:hypothetical protein [Paenibacillus monticola]|uniref:Uncharacterized protein n=1 Tax=Paenibacillus monticola TaxID=2666075 RepID=A0A7X2H2V5_9BACL|nr:hypothetical protein [Paenibacillus monticola]MRN52561.1 hypothetical protein [Paenibacillus monticola]
MKWVSFLLVALSVLSLGGLFGFSLFTVLTGMVGGFMASFAIVAYLHAIKRDYPNDAHENQYIKYGSNFSNM